MLEKIEKTEQTYKVTNKEVHTVNATVSNSPFGRSETWTLRQINKNTWGISICCAEED